MSLNIKDPEAHRLAQQIARATGETMTRVVTEALRERLAKIERARSRASVEELLAIADRAAAHVKRPYLDHAELLYDEQASRNDRRHVRPGRHPLSRAGSQKLRRTESRRRRLPDQRRKLCRTVDRDRKPARS